jgi:predicted SAM-dependent methyltransferase
MVERLSKRIHVGSGSLPLRGWLNLDIQDLPGVDFVADVRNGLPFAGVELIYAEHFVEHLPLDDALKFLEECRRVLAPRGILRLSTPSLDWVYVTHYRIGAWKTPDEAVFDSLQMNKAFHGFGHQFLYNRPMLHASLKAAGFATVTDFAYGESRVPALTGIERHEKSPDTPALPHVLIVEATGIGPRAELPAEAMRIFREALEAR